MPHDESGHHDLTARLLTSDGDWAQLRDDWERLYGATPDITPWQSWDLLSRWWQSQRGSRLLRIVVVARDGVAQLILPLQLSVLPPLQLRVLEPIGMPDDINRPRLALGHPDASAFAKALELLWRNRGEWDAIRIDEKQPGDQEVAWLGEFATRTRSTLRRAPFHPCPYLELKAPWPAYLSSRGTRLAKNLRAARRCLEARGTVTARRFDRPDEVLRAFDTLIDLHERSWKNSDRVGLSQSQRYRDFYREFVAARAALGQARAWVLECNSQAVAATLAFHDGSTYFSAQIAHDDAFSRCSPGTLLEAIELEDLHAEGRIGVFDFLGGALNNKLRWTDQVRQTERIWLLRRSPRGALFDRYYFGVKPHLKPLLARWRARFRTPTVAAAPMNPP